MKLRKPNSRTLAKQQQVADFILSGHTYREAAIRFQYRSEAGARWAFKQWAGRQEQGTQELRREVAVRLQSIVDSYSGEGLAGDGEAARTVMTALRDLSRLLGLNRESATVNVGVSAATFAEQFVQLAQVAPEAMRRVAPSLPDDVLVLLPAAERERIAAAEAQVPGEDHCPGTNGWANVSDQDIGGSYRSHRAAPFGHDDENEGCAPFCGPMTAEWVQPPSGEGVRPPAGDTAAGVTDSGDPDNGGGPVETVEAELVPLPPAQRRVKAPVDGNGVPYDRGGIHRRLPGPGSRGYNPLAYNSEFRGGIIMPRDD